MRGELFPERDDELQRIINENNINVNDVVVNEHIAQDIKLLQTHYTILLDYAKSLEIKLSVERHQRRKVTHELRMLKDQGIVSSSNENEIIIKQLKCSNAGLKSVVTKKDKEIEQIRLLLSESLKEINDLKKFKKDVIGMLNKNGG